LGPERSDSTYTRLFNTRVTRAARATIAVPGRGFAGRSKKTGLLPLGRTTTRDARGARAE
jgi:hypothetical protein